LFSRTKSLAINLKINRVGRAVRAKAIISFHASVKARTARPTLQFVIPTAPYLALGEKHADMQTFQVFKTWKV
jgi:hypothetical protein